MVTSRERKPQVVGVYFNDGCTLGQDRIYVSAKVKGVDPEQYSFSRMCLYNARSPLAGGGPRWGYDDLNGWDVVSVCPFTPSGSTNPARVVALCSTGKVNFHGPAVPEVKETLPDVAASVSQIRQIGHRLYVCGMQGQVFRRDEDGWRHIDTGIFNPSISAGALHLNGIDGTSEGNVFVCGFGGRILQFDGARWHEHSPPTNLHLERVLCVSPTEVYFCGNEGTFFRMTNGGFTDFSIRTDEHFWGMATFEGRTYLATLKGLHVFDGSRVRPLRTGLTPEIGGYRLDARDGQLWSFGVEDVAWFDGQTWTRLKHPDNP